MDVVARLARQLASATRQVTAASNSQDLAQTQGATSFELKKEKDYPLGSDNYALYGVSVFGPANLLGEKVAVRGVLLGKPGQLGLNVTSLQSIGTKCDERVSPF